jgi:hypothetical protein
LSLISHFHAPLFQCHLVSLYIHPLWHVPRLYLSAAVTHSDYKLEYAFVSVQRKPIGTARFFPSPRNRLPFIHSAVCLTTGPYPISERVLLRVRSSSPLILVPNLPKYTVSHRWTLEPRIGVLERSPIYLICGYVLEFVYSSSGTVFVNVTKPPVFIYFISLFIYVLCCAWSRVFLFVHVHNTLSNLKLAQRFIIYCRSSRYFLKAV